MITILHGDNIAASRRELTKIKEAAKSAGEEVVELNGRTVTITELVQAVQSDALFAAKRLVVVENFLSGKKTLKFPWDEARTDIVFWEERAISNLGNLSSLSNLPKPQVKDFKTPAIVFKLADSLLPGNGRSAVLLFRECLKNEEAEMIFAMIVRQFRLMLNPVNLPLWQEKKITRQRNAFDLQRLKGIYRQLLELDYQNKQGLLLSDLNIALELFLLSL